jgi:hypothetical protein
MTYAKLYAAELRAEATRLRKLARRLDRRARNDPVRAREARVTTARANARRKRESTYEAFRGAFRRLGPGWHTSTSLAAEAGISGCGSRIAALRDLCEMGEVVHNGRSTRMSRFRWASYPEPAPEPMAGDREPIRTTVELVVEFVTSNEGWHTSVGIAAGTGFARNTTSRAIRALIAEGAVVSNGRERHGRKYARPGTAPEPAPAPTPAPASAPAWKDGRERPQPRSRSQSRSQPRLPATQAPQLEAGVRAALADGEIGLTALRNAVRTDPDSLGACLHRLVAVGVLIMRQNPDRSLGAERVLVRLREGATHGRAG